MFHRIACMLLLALACAGAHAERVIAYMGKDGKLHCAKVETGKPYDCRDQDAFWAQGKQPVQEAFTGRDFDKLDALYTQWCQGKDRFADGSWYLEQYFDGLHEKFIASDDHDRDLDTITAWQKAHPQSEAARLVEGQYWRSQAWAARGVGYAQTVSQQGWTLFHDRLAKARKVIDGVITAGSSCPAPDSLQMSVMYDLGDREAADQLFDRAVAKFPEYHALYYARMRFFQPKWGGSPQAFERFARETVMRTAKFEGAGMYARLYILTDAEDGIPFIGEPGSVPSWSRLKAGYDDLLRKYPDSHSLPLRYLTVVCRTDDDALYQSLRARTVGFENDTLYPLPVSLDDCDVRHHWTPPKPQEAPGQPDGH